jgi:hypothetical protein
MDELLNSNENLALQKTISMYDAYDDVWSSESNDHLMNLDWGIDLLDPAPPLPPLSAGQIVRIANGESAAELAQIVSADEERRACLVKSFPRLDYPALKSSPIRTQKWINKSRPVSYQAPVVAFDVDFFQPDELELRVLPIGEDNVMCHFWDGDYYIGKFIYRWYPWDSLFPLGENGITRMEKARFTNGIAPFERDIPFFLQHLEETKVETRIVSRDPWWKSLVPRAASAPTRHISPEIRNERRLSAAGTQ